MRQMQIHNTAQEFVFMWWSSYSSVSLQGHYATLNIPPKYNDQIVLFDVIWLNNFVNRKQIVKDTHLKREKTRALFKNQVKQHNA